MGKSERFEMRVSDDLLARLDAARGHEPRASFVKRAVEAALGSQGPLNGEMRVLPDGSSERFVVGEGWVQVSRGRVESSQVVPSGEIQALLEREFLEPEPSAGCPECGGDMHRDGATRTCEDCGFTERS